MTTLITFREVAEPYLDRIDRDNERSWVWACPHCPRLNPWVKRAFLPDSVPLTPNEDDKAREALGAMIARHLLSDHPTLPHVARVVKRYTRERRIQKWWSEFRDGLPRGAGRVTLRRRSVPRSAAPFLAYLLRERTPTRSR